MAAHATAPIDGLRRFAAGRCRAWRVLAAGRDRAVRFFALPTVRLRGRVAAPRVDVDARLDGG